MSPIGAATDLSAGCKIVIGGPLDPVLAAALMEVRVETTVGLPDVCTLRFAESDPDGSDTLKVIDSPKFKLGAPLVVQLAKPAKGQLAEVFNGEITTVEAELGSSAGNAPTLELTVTGHDRSHRMHRFTKTRTFRQMMVIDVARKMAGEHGLRIGKLAPLPGGPAEERHQVGETDWEFLSRLVANNGGELDVAAGALSIVDPSKPAPQVAELVYGETLQRFRPRVSSVGQAAQVTVPVWDPQAKRMTLGTGVPKASTTVEDKSVKMVVPGSNVIIPTAHVSTMAEGTARAKAAALQLGHERVQGTAVAVGDPKLLAGANVKFSGVGKRFAGMYRIVSAVHVYGTRGYTAQLTLGAGGRPLVEMMNGGGRGPRFADHVVIGLVTSNIDPEQLGRVKVRYPVFDQDVESGWARIAWGAAGQARGTVAIPHVNDEVAIAFVHGDVRRPIIIGALFNGMDKPGADLVKVTSSLASRYPRDIDVATKMKTLYGSDMGIDVKSATGPIAVAAGTELKLTASAGGPPSPITISTTGQIKADGKLGVEITAAGPISIKGQAPVTVETNALLQLKGSIIQVQATGILQLSGATVLLG
jgi:phage protein D